MQNTYNTFFTMQHLLRGFVVISLYNSVFRGNLFTNGISELPIFISPSPAFTFVI